MQRGPGMHLGWILPGIWYQTGQAGVFFATDDGASSRHTQDQTVPL